MAVHSLERNFQRFLARINPGESYEATAASEYRNISKLLESSEGPAAEIRPRCFLQGSYRQQTAIYTINDIDIVALCDLYYPGSGSGRSYPRDDIFSLLARALQEENRYRHKLRYEPQSLCIKIDLSIKVEILPAVKPQGARDFDHEPFKIYRPETGQWIDAYARLHQAHLTDKNKSVGSFKPMIKTIKHLRDFWGLDIEDAVSFHIECLLYRVPHSCFTGALADAVEAVLASLAGFGPDLAAASNITSPCGDKTLFSESEWGKAAYTQFHNFVKRWAVIASSANRQDNRNDAIESWKQLLGGDYFPRDVL